MRRRVVGAAFLRAPMGCVGGEGHYYNYYYYCYYSYKFL